MEALDTVAKGRGASRIVVALAWLLKHTTEIIPIVGSTDPVNIREAAKADEVETAQLGPFNRPGHTEQQQSFCCK